MCFNRFVTSVCTVDFEIPNFLAVNLTVALVSVIYFANSIALSSTIPLIVPPFLTIIIFKEKNNSTGIDFF